MVLCYPDDSEVEADDDAEWDEDGDEEVGDGTRVTPWQQRRFNVDNSTNDIAFLYSILENAK